MTRRPYPRLDRAATDIRLTRMFLVGLTVPAVVLLGAILLIRPDTPLQWLAVAVTPFAASAIVATIYAYRSRGEQRATIAQSRDARRST